MRRSNFSGVILLRTLAAAWKVCVSVSPDHPAWRPQTHPLTLRMSRSCSSEGPARVHGLAARTISAPASPAGSGVRSTAPSLFEPPLRTLPRLTPACAALPA